MRIEIEKRIDLTEREYDKTVEFYEKTGDSKYLKILQNCRILCNDKLAGSEEKIVRN